MMRYPWDYLFGDWVFSEPGIMALFLGTRRSVGWMMGFSGSCWLQTESLRSCHESWRAFNFSGVFYALGLLLLRQVF
jgi:hypothetical protein